MYLILSLTFSNLSSSGNTITSQRYGSAPMEAHERKCASLSMTTIKYCKEQKDAKKSTLTINGLPSGVVENQYDNTSTISILRVTGYDFHDPQIQLQVRQRSTTMTKSLRRGFLFSSSNQRYQIKKNKKKGQKVLCRLKEKHP